MCCLKMITIIDDSVKPEKFFSRKQINSILYSDPFLKAGFFSKIVKNTKINILYLDLDLLYSGYVTSGMLASQENLTLLQPTTKTIEVILTELLTKSSPCNLLS